VARRLVDAGSMLTAGTPLFTLVDDALFEFRAAVPSADYGKLRVGAPVEVSIDALPGKSSTGKVARITPLVDERTRSFEVVVQVPGGAELVGGLFARARVRVGQVAGALVVPPGALLRNGSNEAEAFVVAGTSAERRTITLGLETPQLVQVASGLEAGERVVLDPPAALEPGTPLDVQPERER
jgi:membrane fusion protein (multidrug efflux system)